MKGSNVITGKIASCDAWWSVILALGILFFAITVWTSYARWADFHYRTFDLAYYTQAIWQFLHGRFEVTVEPVPLLGNHVEPIVFLIAPLFAIFRHPMTFVVVQNAALATMGPVGFDIGKRLGLKPMDSWFLAAALLLAPAAGYIALHEFHPEALSAPLLLLMFRARLLRSLAQHWIWFAGVLACKENMAPLLVAYCAVQLVVQRKSGLSDLAKWYVWPSALAVVWFLICVLVITPALNSGQIDYGGLYSQIGDSAGDILVKAITQPLLVGKSLWKSLSAGNLVWALLFPFLCLPLLKPRWLLIATPILLQHLLSWRSSEWNIYLHYAAPLLPLFWIATAEALSDFTRMPMVPLILRMSMTPLILAACIVAQGYFGPAREISSATEDWLSGGPYRAQKNAFISQISAEAGVVAPLPYLSHLALREQLYSLHYIIKGLKTLSRAAYTPPPPPKFVLIDYGDSSTFDASSGYYHPTMKMTDGKIIPASDQALHDFLKSRFWDSCSSDTLTLLRQRDRLVRPNALSLTHRYLADVAPGNRLVSIAKPAVGIPADGNFDIKMTWDLLETRDVFPWMLLRVTPQRGGASIVLIRGLCAPEASAGVHEETWNTTSLRKLPAGDYLLEVVFVDNTRRSWNEATATRVPEVMLCPPISLGVIRISAK